MVILDSSSFLEVRANVVFTSWLFIVPRKVCCMDSLVNEDTIWVLKDKCDLEVKRWEKELREEVEASFHIILCENYQNYGLGRMFSKTFFKSEREGNLVWMEFKKFTSSWCLKRHNYCLPQRPILLLSWKTLGLIISLNHPCLICHDFADICRPWCETGIHSVAHRRGVFQSHGCWAQGLPWQNTGQGKVSCVPKQSTRCCSGRDNEVYT